MLRIGKGRSRTIATFARSSMELFLPMMEPSERSGQTISQRSHCMSTPMHHCCLYLSAYLLNCLKATGSARHAEFLCVCPDRLAGANWVGELMRLRGRLWAEFNQSGERC
jgi:hypothetical protein